MLKLIKKENLGAYNAFHFKGYNHTIKICYYPQMPKGCGDITLKLYNDNVISPGNITLSWNTAEELILSSDKPLYISLDDWDEIVTYVELLRLMESEIKNFISQIRNNEL